MLIYLEGGKFNIFHKIKMNPIKELIKEHEDIERELIELEEISNTRIVNIPNLSHVLNKIIIMWNQHEEKEEQIFQTLEKLGYKIPIEKILCEHQDLKIHFSMISNALLSGSEFETKESLKHNGKTIIKKIREHKNFEDEILYTLPEDLQLDSLNIE